MTALFTALFSRIGVCAVTLIGLTLLAAPVFATTKGLNQIVTPDIQPEGILSISLQGQNSAIGNPEQIQLEQGITKKFEVAYFQGFHPGESVAAFEYGLVQTKQFLLSTGITGIETRHKSSPYVEGGYYLGKGFVIAGVQESPYLVPILGAGYYVTPKIELMTDYLGGADNFATIGATFTLAPNLTFNPAIYFSNSKPHKTYGYGVLSWNMKIW